MSFAGGTILYLVGGVPPDWEMWVRISQGWEHVPEQHFSQISPRSHKQKDTELRGFIEGDSYNTLD